jgi:Domain of unknown function (DUF4383)
MKNTQKFALIIGIVYVLIGILGSIPALISQPSSLPSYVENLGVSSGYGYLLGLFPVNSVLNGIHIATGIIGIIASISLDSSRLFSGQLGIYYTAFSILGLFSFTNIFFGIFPLYGFDVLLHVLTGLSGIYFGFFAAPSLLKLWSRA